MALSAEERSILRIAKLFEEMVATEAWKEYRKILESQVSERERLALMPLAEMQGDFYGRAAHMECIKGAIIGLRLALSIPASTIDHAKDILREEKSDE